MTPNIPIRMRRSILWMLSILECVALVFGGTGNEWNYEAPETWKNTYPYCGGNEQSPINVDTSTVQIDTGLGEFFLGGYGTVSNVKMNLENNGHTVKVDLKTENVFIKGASLEGRYIADQFHFHWGTDDSRGSEHSINGDYAPMEMHIVHHSDNYSNLSEAQTKHNGLAVLGFLFKVGKHNFHFDDIIIYFDQISHKNDHSLLVSFPLLSLLPSNLDLYFRYQGSLTTPPCYQSVIWTLFKTPIEISEQQLDVFRNSVFQNTINETDAKLAGDYRPLQKLNHRKVFGSHPDILTDGISIAHCVSPVVSVYLICLCIVFKLSI